MMRVRLVSVPSMMSLEFGTNSVFVELAVTIKAAGKISGSPTVKEMVLDVSSFIVWAGTEEMTGGLFTGRTVRRNEVLLFVTPSLTVMVTCAEPF